MFTTTLGFTKLTEPWTSWCSIIVQSFTSFFVHISNVSWTQNPMWSDWKWKRRFFPSGMISSCIVKCCVLLVSRYFVVQRQISSSFYDIANSPTRYTMKYYHHKFFRIKKCSVEFIIFLVWKAMSKVGVFNMAIDKLQ